MKGIAIIVNPPPESGVEDSGEWHEYTMADFDGGLAELQAVVGGWIEPAPTSRQVTIWVNEEGKYLDLPVNRLAMDVWIPYDTHGCMMIMRDWLAGNVVITGGVDANGETMDLAERDRRWVERVARDRGGVKRT